MSEETLSKFENCPEEENHPFAMIPNELIRDLKIAPEVRWFIIYLLSHDLTKWHISIPYVIKTQKISKNRIYRIIKEAIASGYVKRIDYLDKGKKRFKYFVSRTAKFKKCLPCPQNKEIEKQGIENEDAIEYQSSSKEEEREEQYIKEPTPQPLASALSHFFLEKIKEVKKDFKPASFKTWEKDFDKMIRIDKRDPEKIKEVISWLVTDETNLIYIQSPQKLRKEFDTLEIKMKKFPEKELINKNRSWAIRRKELYPEEFKKMSFDTKYVRNMEKAKELPLNMDHQRFKELLIRMFGGEYGK